MKPRQEPIAQEWLSQKQVAQLMGVHVDTIKNYRKAHLIGWCRLPGGQVRIHRKEVARAMKERNGER
jgi:excisionase family DNA binding protein